MFNTTDTLCLILTDIAIELNDTNTISDAQLTKYKTEIDATVCYNDAQQFKPMELLEVIRNYALAHRKDLNIYNTMLGILGKVSTAIYPLNSPFIAKFFLYKYEDYPLVIDKIANLEGIDGGNPVDNVYLEADYLTTILRLYLSSPTMYIDKIKTVKARLDVIIPQRDDLLKKVLGK